MNEDLEIHKYVKDGSNVVVYNAPANTIEGLSFGESTGIVDFCKRKTDTIDSVMWNEEYLAVRTTNGHMVRFQPELNEEISTFFKHKERRLNVSDWTVVWEGDYEKVKFTKKALLDFLSRHADELDSDVKKQIQEMRVMEKIDTSSISLDDTERTIEDETKKTSIPKEFSATIKIAESWSAKMMFRASVERNVDDYGRPQKGYSIVMELSNARQIKRDLMKFVLERIPENIPRYYGKLKLLNLRGDEL
jgi:hypothetical protein